MPGPTPIATYFVAGAGVDNSALTTPSFTPSDGELIVVKMTTWSTADGNGAATGGNQSFSTKVTAAPGGFNGYARVDSAVVNTSLIGGDGSMAVTSGGTSGNTRHCMTVERWPAGCTPGAVNSTINGSGAPSANITTTAVDSALSWAGVDVSTQDPAGRTYRLSAIEDGLGDFHTGNNSVQYFAYATGAAVTSAGPYAIGMTAPGSQTWVMAGLEVKAPAGVSQAINPAIETDTARPLGRVKSRLLAAATMSETAQPLGRRRTRALAVAAETDSAVHLGGADEPVGRGPRDTARTPVGRHVQSTPIGRSVS